MSRRTLFAALLALMVSAPALLAQDKPATPPADNNNQGGNRGNRGGGGGGQFDPTRFTGMIKDRMNATDDEWKVIEPKLTKVLEARRDGMGGMFGRRNRGGDNGGASADTTARSPMETASKDLRDVLDKKEATADEINAKLTAFREAREKSKQGLVTAQKDLKDVLTQRQEAVLVSMGMLD